MKKLKGFLAKYGVALSALALLVGTASANTPCVLYYHQPKVPAAMDQYKK